MLVVLIKINSINLLQTYTNPLKQINKFKKGEGETSSITYPIQTIHSDLVRLRVKSDNVMDIDIQNEIIRLKDRMNGLETLLKTKFNIIKNSMNEVLKARLQKL